MLSIRRQALANCDRSMALRLGFRWSGARLTKSRETQTPIQSRREKIAEAKRGKKRPASVVEALREANLGKTLSAETRAKIGKAHRDLGTLPPAAGVPWPAEEDDLVRLLPARHPGARSASVGLKIQISERS